MWVARGQKVIRIDDRLLDHVNEKILNQVHIHAPIANQIEICMNKITLYNNA